MKLIKLLALTCLLALGACETPAPPPPPCCQSWQVCQPCRCADGPYGPCGCVHRRTPAPPTTKKVAEKPQSGPKRLPDGRFEAETPERLEPAKTKLLINE